MYTTQEFRTQVYLYYEENGITVGDPSVGRWEHAHIVPRCVGGTETVLLLHGHHCYHDLLQSKEYNRQCFHQSSTRAWLYGDGFMCEGWFMLVELFDEYNGEVVRRTWETMSTEERRARNAPARAGTSDRWATLTPEELSAEQSRRARLQWEGLTPEERRQKNAHSSANAKSQAARMTPEERSALARLGGQACAARMTPEERSASARRASQARWARRKSK